MASSEELQLSFDVLNPQHLKNAQEQEANFNKRVADLSKKVKSAEWDQLSELIHAVNEEKGFWGDPVEMDKWVAKLGLVISEVVEVIEALRKSQGTKAVTEEFADIFIRTLDIYSVLVKAGEADPNLYSVIAEKVETNKNRPPKHGNRWG